MGMQSQAGSGMVTPPISDSGGPYYYSANDDGSVTLRADQQVVFITEDHDSADKTLTLPPVAEADGKFYYFYRSASGTQSVLVQPNGWVSGLNGGDSQNWDGSTGYDLDAQYDHLLLLALGGVWITVSNGIA